ncbi:MAG: uracil phosphoribosyltransferase [Calditrichia bacterium]
MMKKFSNLTIIDHPLMSDKLFRIRDKHTPSGDFRRLLKEVAILMTYEVCRHFEITQKKVDSPLESTRGFVLKREITVVPILRAGLGMIDGVMSVIPEVRVGMLGLYRDEDTLLPVDYYKKLPENLDQMEVVLVDPMLATGGSAAAAAGMLKKAGSSRLTMMSLIAAPEGVERMLLEHPDVHIYTAVLDRQLNEKGYILPGLGDAGDRCFGT